MANINQRLSDRNFELQRRKKTGEITGSGIDVVDGEIGMPIRSQFVGLKLERQNQQQDRLNNFDIYDSDKDIPLEDVAYYDSLEQPIYEIKDWQATTGQLKFNPMNHSWDLWGWLSSKHQQSICIDVSSIINTLSVLYASANGTSEIIMRNWFGCDKSAVAQGMNKNPFSHSWMVSPKLKNHQFAKQVKPFLNCKTDQHSNNSKVTSQIQITPLWDAKFKSGKSIFGQQRVPVLIGQNVVCDYAEDAEYRMIELFANQLKFGIIISKSGELPAISANQYNQLSSHLRQTRLSQVVFPQFNIKDKIKLNTIMKKLGFADLFTKPNNFIHTGSTVISNWTQNNEINVNVAMTRTASASDLYESQTGTLPGNAFIVSTPFVYYVKYQSQIILIGSKVN